MCSLTTYEIECVALLHCDLRDNGDDCLIEYTSWIELKNYIKTYLGVYYVAIFMLSQYDHDSAYKYHIKTSVIYDANSWYNRNILRFWALLMEISLGSDVFL